MDLLGSSIIISSKSSLLAPKLADSNVTCLMELSVRFIFSFTTWTVTGRVRPLVLYSAPGDISIAFTLNPGEKDYLDIDLTALPAFLNTRLEWLFLREAG